MPETTCYLSDIVIPNWDIVKSSHIDALYRWMSASKWFGAKDHRMGFVKLIRQDQMIGGFFSCEGSRESKQYDDAKVPEEHYETSFQDLFFILFTDEGQLLLQERKIFDYVDLGMDTIRRNLLRILADGLRASGVPTVDSELNLESAGGRRTQEELLQVFRKYKVRYVEITNLSGSDIPESIQDIFNPKIELMPTMRTIVADTLKKGVDQVRVISDNKPESDLGHAPIVYALATAGQIEKIEAIDENSSPIQREKEERAEIRFEIPVPTQLTSDILIRISQRLDSLGRLESVQYRRQQRNANSRRGTFFDDNQK